MITADTLDDALGQAVELAHCQMDTCVVRDDATLRTRQVAYSVLRRKKAVEAQGWLTSDGRYRFGSYKANRAILETYYRVYRERLGLDDKGE